MPMYILDRTHMYNYMSNIYQFILFILGDFRDGYRRRLQRIQRYQNKFEGPTRSDQFISERTKNIDRTS